MVKTITYDDAVKVVAQHYKGNMFDASILLCHLFDSTEKEMVMNDLLTERMKVIR